MTESRNTFALPPVTPKTTRDLRAVSSFIADRTAARADARDIIKGLVKDHGATVTYPSYRTAVRCCGIYTEVAAHSELAEANMLLEGINEKASAYLLTAGDETPDLFGRFK